MKRIFYISMCLSMASLAWAMSITNGDFEAQSGTANAADVAGWYDYHNNDASYWDGPWFRGDGAATINETGCLFLGQRANTDQDGGHATYVYQSIGTYDGTLAVRITLQWGGADDQPGGDMGLTVMILESDGTFVPGEWYESNDVYGASGITEIARGSIIRDVDPGDTINESFLLDLSSATVGKELFLRINNFKVVSIPWINLDNITLTSLALTNQAPEDGATFVPTERTSAGNDLVFNVADPVITEVDVLFGPDPNLPAVYKIVDGMSVSPGQYTITLETELAEDLDWSTEYFWKVLAYEPNIGGGVLLKGEGPLWSFTTIQEGPYLGDVTPGLNRVSPGENAVFSVSSMKANTFQWYKEGDPDAALSNSDPGYAGVNTDTLTVLNAQLDDAGFYYCVGTETATGLTAQSLSSGELFIKELKSYYPFETTYTVGDDIYTPDIISGKDAKLMAGASLADANSLIGKYLKLENPAGARTEYATITDTTVAHYENITISAWVRLADVTSRWTRVFDCGLNATEYFFLTMLYRQDDATRDGQDVARCEFRWVDDEGDGHNPEIDGAGEINADEWIFVVVTIDGNTGKIYLNGQYAGQENVTSPINITKSYNYLGRPVGFDEPYYNGLIDELKIYNYPKTLDEIAQEYMDIKTDVEFICNMQDYNLSDYDYDGDCQVGLSDLAVFVERWLEDARIYPD